MKPTLLLATMSVILASPVAFGRSELSELEKLRLRCQEQERQIHLLEEENSQLRGEMEAPSGNLPGGGLQLISTSTKTVATSSAGSANYTVKSGDSFFSIARAKGTTAETLAKANGLNVDSVIRPGQVLKVPTAAAVREATKPTPAAPAPAADRDLPRTHKIAQGETFSSIARKYKVSVAALLAANPKAKPTALRPGQIVNIPGGTPDKSTAKTPEKSAPAKSIPAPKKAQPAPEKSRAEAPAPVGKADKPAPAEKLAVSDPVPKVHPITIDNEMTYGEFAAKYGTDTKRLNALNGLDLTTATVLAKGSELYVPAN